MPSILTRAGVMTTAFYMAYFMVQGVHAPFWPLWLEDWGLGASEIAIFTALSMATRVVAGLTIPSIADRLDARRHTLAVCILAALGLFLAHPFIGDKAVLLAATLAVGASFAGISPIAEALGVAASRAHAFPYAQARGLGSVGFVAGNVVVGALIARIGVDVALWTIVVCLLAALALTPGHPGGGRVKGAVPPRMREIGRLFVEPTFALFLAAVAFVQASHATFFALGSLHWAKLGVSDAKIGALWAAAVVAEILLMVLFGSVLIRKLGAIRALVWAGAAGLVRWGAMAFDPVGWTLWPLQALHCLTFALGHLGAIAFIAEAVPPRLGAAAQGAMGSMAVGLLFAVGMGIGGLLYPSLGGMTYGIGFVYSAIGLVLAWRLGSLWRGGALPL